MVMKGSGARSFLLFEGFRLDLLDLLQEFRLLDDALAVQEVDEASDSTTS